MDNDHFILNCVTVQIEQGRNSITVTKSYTSGSVFFYVLYACIMLYNLYCMSRVALNKCSPPFLLFRVLLVFLQGKIKKDPL